MDDRAIRIIHGAQVYSRVAPGSLYEGELRSLLLTHATYAFCGYKVLPFDPVVTGNQGLSARPDLALIDLEYRSWWVVEVELCTHSLESHVLPQLAVLRDGDYGPAMLSRLVRHWKEADRARLEVLLRATPPRFLVVSDLWLEEWWLSLAAVGVGFVAFELFRNQRNELAWVVKGQVPSLPKDFVSACRIDPIVPRFLWVQSPGALTIQDEVIELLYDGGITQWKPLKLKDKVWLSPLGRNMLTPGAVYEIWRDRSGRYSLRGGLRERGNRISRRP